MQRLAIATALFVTAGALVLLLTPLQVDPNRVFRNADKLVHVLMFAVLAGSWRWAGLRPGTALILGAALAVGTEVLQWLAVPGRSGDPLDACADVLGVVLGLSGVTLAKRAFGWRSPRTIARERQDRSGP